MLEFQRTRHGSLAGKLNVCKPFLAKLAEAFKDIPDDKKPLIAKISCKKYVEVVDCAFGKVPNGCPLSYQRPLLSSLDYSPHEAASPPPLLPIAFHRLKPVVGLPDLSTRELEYLKALGTSWDAAHSLECDSRELSESVEELRRVRLTSRFWQICHLKSGRSHAEHLVFKMQKGSPVSRKTKVNKQQMPEALREYCRHLSVNWFPCGVVIHPDAPWLGAVPDGLVFDPSENPEYGLVHVECPQTQSFVDCHFLNFQCSVVELRKSNACYWQMQGEMMVTGTDWCDLLVYTEEDLLVQRIYRNKAMVKVMKEKLDSFFFYHYLPSLTSV